MRTVEQLESGAIKEYIKCVLVSPPGEGKTHLAATFPKCVFLQTCPGEIDTVLNKPELKQNLVGWEEFILNAEETSKAIVDRLHKFLIDEIRPGIASGEIETVVVDNLTYLAELFWTKIGEHDRHLYKGKGGLFDTRGAYGGLKDMLLKFFLRELITLKCNVVINAHLMLEDDDTLEKRPDKTVPYNAAVLGGFRDKLPGMLSYVFYLEKSEAMMSNGKMGYKYLARTNKSMGKAARTRLELPTIIENVSYDTLLAAITEARK